MRDCAGNSDHVRSFTAESESAARHMANMSDDDRVPFRLLKIDGIEVEHSKIDELINQSGVATITTNGLEHVRDGCYIISPEKLQEFTKLIIMKCAQVCADRGSEHDGLYAAWAADCSNRIEKHFGIEE